MSNDMPQILVIDDSEVMLSRIKLALVNAGYETTVTTSAVGNGRYLATMDLIIIDYHMPGISGGTVIQSLRGAAKAERECLLYLYTSDKQIAANYLAYGFHGSFVDKGDEASLVRQVGAVFRMRMLRAMARRPKKV